MMRKWIFIIIALLIIGVIAYNYIYKKHKIISKEIPEFTMNVNALKNEFSSNNLNSEQKYLNKILDLTGNLTVFDSEQLNPKSIGFLSIKRF